MKTTYNPGDKVHYKPEYGKIENGIVKLMTASGDGAFVVYNCNNDWENYKNYTAASTNLRDLHPGWYVEKLPQVNIIYKYPLKVGNNVVIMPLGAKILSLQVQKETPCIWALCDQNEKEHEQRIFEVLGTGFPVKEGLEKGYLGTFLLYGGSYVGHVFEVDSNEKEDLSERINDLRAKLDETIQQMKNIIYNEPN